MQATFELAVELARELDARDWPGTAPGFLAVVRAEAPGPRTDEEPDWDFDEEEDGCRRRKYSPRARS